MIHVKGSAQFLAHLTVAIFHLFVSSFVCLMNFYSYPQEPSQISFLLWNLPCFCSGKPLFLFYASIRFYPYLHYTQLEFGSFPGDSAVKNLPANAGDTKDTGSVSGLGRSVGGGNDNPLQYPCLENSMARGASWTIVSKSLTQVCN